MRALVLLLLTGCVQQVDAKLLGPWLWIKGESETWCPSLADSPDFEDLTGYEAKITAEDDGTLDFYEYHTVIGCEGKFFSIGDEYIVPKGLGCDDERHENTVHWRVGEIQPLKDGDIYVVRYVEVRDDEDELYCTIFESGYLESLNITYDYSPGEDT